MAPFSQTTTVPQLDRLQFRIWRESDFDLMWSLFGDDDVTRFVGGPFTQDQTRERLNREIECQRAHGFQYWPMFLRGSGEFVGCCGLKPYKPEQNIVETGFYIRRQRWGQGLAGEAARAVIVHALDSLEAVAVAAGHHPLNGTSRRLLEKLGFLYSYDEVYPPTNLQHRSYILTRESFLAAARNRAAGGLMPSSTAKYPYDTHLDIKYPPLELIDVPALVAACTHKWHNQTLCKVNGSVVRLGVIQGEYHWHKHDNDDEFFFVVEGTLLIDLEGRTVELTHGKGFVVPKGVLHKTRAPNRTVILMVENAGIIPTGD